MARKSSRRDFLTGRAAADAAADRLKGAAPGDALAEPALPHESCLIHVARRAMGTQFQVFFNAGQYANAVEAAVEALDLIDGLEEQLSAFRPTSELSRINALAADGPVNVEPRLFQLLELALHLGRETNGAYDITSGPLWKAWGFARRAGKVPTEAQLEEARHNVGYHLVQLDPQHQTIRFLRPGVELNLGSIGKGYALDRAAEVLAAAGIGDFLFHAGQSSVLARGSVLALRQPGPTQPTAWTVGIRHPLRRRARLGEVVLCDGALGTSGTENQFFRHAGRRYGHILDPRSGQPADSLLSATVIAPTAALADALSTAFFVMGAEAALDYCRTHPECAALLLRPARDTAGFELCTANLTEWQWRLHS